MTDNIVPNNFRKMHKKLRELFKINQDQNLSFLIDTVKEEMTLDIDDPASNTTKQYFFPCAMLQIDCKMIAQLWLFIHVKENSQRYVDVNNNAQAILI